MKKLIEIVTIFVVVIILGEVSYGAEYLDNVEFIQKSMKKM